MNRKQYRLATVACKKLSTKKERIRAISGVLGCTQRVAARIEPAMPMPWSRTTGKTPERRRIESKLQKIADALPTTGHSMGSIQHARMGKYSASCARTRKYAKSCKWQPTHGAIMFQLSPADYSKIQIIGGIVTIVTGNTRSRRIKKCRYIVRTGEKNHARLVWEDGFLTGDYHGTYDQCMKRLVADKITPHAAKKTASRRDSILAGNCAVGTDAFIRRHGLDPARRYAKKYLYEIAEPFELRYVKRVFGE